MYSDLVRYLCTVGSVTFWGVTVKLDSETHTNLSYVGVLDWHVLSSECSLLNEGHSEMALYVIKHKI